MIALKLILNVIELNQKSMHLIFVKIEFEPSISSKERRCRIQAGLWGHRTLHNKLYGAIKRAGAHQSQWGSW